MQRRIGVQLQSTALFDHLTTGEMLELFCRFYGPCRGARCTRCSRPSGCREGGRAGRASSRAASSSALAIALALVHEPEIVFLDEPTTGLDPQARRNLWDVIRGDRRRRPHGRAHDALPGGGRGAVPAVAIMDARPRIVPRLAAGLVRALGRRGAVRFVADGLPLDGVRALPAVDLVAPEDGAFELASTTRRRRLSGSSAPAERARRRAAATSRCAADAGRRVPGGLTGREFRE